ncbi:MAG: hypothetical protein OXB84_05675, partial [Halobacteriovoraceae bacterium]|nr:hypothetical protein [Halobacteriovoraceae bacterium]
MLDEQREIILSYPKLKERIEAKRDPKEEIKKILNNIDEIRAGVSSNYLGFVGKFLDKAIY